MVDHSQLRIIEIIGGIIGIVYCILGVKGLLDTNPDGQMRAVMKGISVSSFLTFTGLGAALVCLGTSESMGRQLGFLKLWKGRGWFFLILGCYVYPSFCTSGNYSSYGNTRYYNHCKDGDMLTTLAIIASATSICLGIIILVLTCTSITERVSVDVIGIKRQALEPLDFVAALASAGMILMGASQLFETNLKASATALSAYLSTAFILLILGVTSLIATLRSSGFVCAFFGFLDRGYNGSVTRGLFYVLMGFFTFGLYYGGPNAGRTPWEMFCWISSIASMGAGVVIMVLGCR